MKQKQALYICGIYSIATLLCANLEDFCCSVYDGTEAKTQDLKRLENSSCR